MLETYIPIIFRICIIPILGILTKWICAFLTKKMNELQARTDNEIFNKYYSMLNNTITRCVIATNQTYVETLKQENRFDLEAQKIAFNITKDAILNILGEEAINYLNTIIGDLDAYINEEIEANVNLCKGN